MLSNFVLQPVGKLGVVVRKQPSVSGFGPASGEDSCLERITFGRKCRVGSHSIIGGADMKNSILAGLGLIFVGAVSAWASTTGTISGVVSDPSGGVVPGAEVT